jgi:hypothetical protein
MRPETWEAIGSRRSFLSVHGCEVQKPNSEHLQQKFARLPVHIAAELWSGAIDTLSDSRFSILHSYSQSRIVNMNHQWISLSVCLAFSLFLCRSLSLNPQFGDIWELTRSKKTRSLRTEVHTTRFAPVASDPDSARSSSLSISNFDEKKTGSIHTQAMTQTPESERSHIVKPLFNCGQRSWSGGIFRQWLGTLQFPSLGKT